MCLQDEQEEFQRAFGAVILTRAGTKVDYVGENFRADIVCASDSDTREQLVKDAQMRLDKVKQNITETVLWRIEVVEDVSGNHLTVNSLCCRQCAYSAVVSHFAIKSKFYLWICCSTIHVLHTL